MLKYLIAGLVCMQSLLAWADTADAFSEVDRFAEQPVVLSASRFSQPVNRAPAAVTVITREMIEASGFRQLVDMLRLLPGMVVGWQVSIGGVLVYPIVLDTQDLATEKNNSVEIGYPCSYDHVRDLRWRGAPQDRKYNRPGLGLVKPWATGRRQAAATSA